MQKQLCFLNRGIVFFCLLKPVKYCILLRIEKSERWMSDSLRKRRVAMKEWYIWKWFERKSEGFSFQTSVSYWYFLYGKRQKNKLLYCCISFVVFSLATQCCCFIKVIVCGVANSGVSTISVTLSSRCCTRRESGNLLVDTFEYYAKCWADVGSHTTPSCSKIRWH